MLSRKDFYGSPASRYMMLMCAWLLCWILGGVMIYFISGDGTVAARLRISLVIQDVVIFILPVVITAVFISRRPAELLCIDRWFSPVNLLLIVMIFIVASPAMNLLISANEHMHLPECMAEVEQWMRQSEESAARTMSAVTAGTSAGTLVMNILIIGCMAGLAEELFFRGGLQRIMTTSGISHHVAIWVTAAIFSAVHMQFFGFFPRLVLGAFFGYLLWWSGSIWVPVCAHAINNSMALILEWQRQRQGAEMTLDASLTHELTMWPWLIIILGVMLAAMMIITLRRRLVTRA